MREEKALSLGSEPEKGPDVTQVYFLLFQSLSFPLFQCSGRNNVHFMTKK